MFMYSIFNSYPNLSKYMLLYNIINLSLMIDILVICILLLLRK